MDGVLADLIETRYRSFVTACVLALLAAPLIFAEGPAFEVASIKSAGPLDPMALKMGKMRIGMTVDAARIDIGFMSITDLIRTAWTNAIVRTWLR